MNASQTPRRVRDDSEDEPDQPPSPRCEPGVVVEVCDETEELGEAGVGRLTGSVRAAAGIAAGSGGGHEVRVLVVGDARMGELHGAHSGITGTTDVLTFDLRDDACGALDVDLVVCLDEARRACAGRGHDEVDELTLYALHGVLHCLGYDDHDEDGFAAMHAREDEVLRAAGLAARFYGSAGGDA